MRELNNHTFCLLSANRFSQEWVISGITMKFLLEFVACCGSSVSRRPAEDARMLVLQEPNRRAAQKHVRARSSGGEWRPSLTSINEDVLTAEKSKNVELPTEGLKKSLRRKVASASQGDRPRSSDHDDYRRSHFSPAMPTFSPAPFMF